MSELEDRFRQKIKDSNFNILEIQGFMAQPELALITGMALGYEMGMHDHGTTLIEALSRGKEKANG